MKSRILAVTFALAVSVVTLVALAANDSNGSEAAPVVGQQTETGDDTSNSGTREPDRPVEATNRATSTTDNVTSEVVATTTSAPTASTVSMVSTVPPAMGALPTAEIALGQVDEGFAETQGLTGGLGQQVVMVTSASDSGQGSYREAIGSGDRIVRFDPSLDGATITLEEAVETDASNLTIDGSGVTVTITGHASRFSGTNIVIAGMTFSNNDDTPEEDGITFRHTDTVQVFGLFGNTFEHAADGLVDVIWNGGNDVYGTICGNLFHHHNKAVLLDSGEDNREGGHYYVTFCDNHWVDVYQRMPLSRSASVHQYNSVFDQYGKADGTGGGSKAGGDGDGASQHLLEGNMAFPRATGETTFDGETVTSPRAEWAGPQLDRDDAAVRIDGSFLGTTGDVTATELEHHREDVFTPPYQYTVHPATVELADVVRAYAGTCTPSGRSGAVNPCAPLLLAADGKLVIQIVPSLDDEVTAGAAKVDLVVGEQHLPARQVDDTSWEIDISALGPGPTPMWAEVTTTDGRTTTSDVVVAGVLS